MDFKLDPITGFTWIQWNTVYFLVDHGRLHFHVDDTVFEDGPMNTPLKVPDDLNFILLSNYESAAWFIHNYANTLVHQGLPPSTHILATKPTLELARICLAEASPYPCPAYEKAHHILETRMVDMMFGQSWKFDATTYIRCYSSGYTLGSCNWVIEHGNHTIGLLGASSDHPDRYFKAFDKGGLKDCTVLLISSIAMESHLDWVTIGIQFQSFLFDHFRDKKSVLIPQTLSKIGYWETLNLLFQFFLNNTNCQRDLYWFVISKESAKTMAYANSALAYLSNWGKDMVEQMLMPVFFYGHPRLGDLKCAVISSISDPVLGRGYHHKKLILAKPHRLLKGLHTCGTSVGETFPLDPRLRIADLKRTLADLRPRTVVTMGAVPDTWAAWCADFRWVNALDQPVQHEAPFIPVTLSPDWVEYEQSVQLHKWKGTPMKKVLIQWDLTTNTIYPVESSRDLASAKVLIQDSQYLGNFDFQTLIDLLIKRGGPLNFTLDGYVATFPDISCQIFYNSSNHEIEVAFDKTENSDFRFLIEACLSELMLELSV